MYPELIINSEETELAEKASSVSSFSLFRPLTALLCLLLITACSGGSGDTSPKDSPTEVQTVGGNATKGPLANADVTVFALDTSAENLRGTQIATGTTNDQANIAVDLPVDTEGLLVVVATANANTTDLTTGQSPVLTRLSTIAVSSEWLDGQPVYATPLSHMAVGIAARNIGGQAEISTAQIRSALARAQKVVRKTVGFGLLDEADDANGPINLFTTAPILTNNSVDASSRQRTLRYRKASEAMVAVIAEISGSTEAEAIETLFDLVTSDLADGRIDDAANAGQLETLEPETLAVPGAPNDQTVGDTLTVINSERTLVGADNEQIEDLVASDDALSQIATADSGLVPEDLAGEVAQLTIGASPSAAGSAALTGKGSSQPFEVGVDDTVTVTALASEGFAFAGWSKNGTVLSTESSYAFPMEADTTLVAEFSANLSIQADPQSGGTPSAGQDFFEPGSTVTLTANPAPGFEFFAWTNSEGATPSMFAEGQDLNTTASFTMPEAPLSLIAVYEFSALADADTQEGEVSRTFDASGNVLLTATPQANFIFVRWIDQDGASLSTQRVDFQVDLAGLDADSQIIAEFALEAAVWDVSNWDEAAWQ